MVKGCVKKIAGKVVETGAEDVFHKIFNFYPKSETDTLHLFEGKKSFIFISKKANLHNISITFQIMLSFISNCYLVPRSLFLI